MDIISEIKTRRSVRKFTDAPVKDEDILQVLEAARLAPSGSNTQPWSFIVIRDGKTKKALAEADHDQKWMLSAPVFIACLTDIRTRIEETGAMLCDEENRLPELKQSIRDTSIAVGYMLLEAEHLGLGSCWTGWYEQKDVKRVLALPDFMYVTGIVALGYADEAPKARPRKALDEIVRYEKW